MNYLNVFEHYRHDAASIPLENNLTRVFARILRDNFYVANCFLNLVNEKLKNYKTGISEIDTSESRISVDIQKKISNIETDIVADLNDEERKKCITGIALTAANIDWNESSDVNSSQRQIPDIVISYNDNVYIVEAKKTEENCRKQLQEYMNGLRADKDRWVSITWDDVIKILERAEKYGYGDLIINEYLEYIKNHFPSLFDCRSLKYIMDEVDPEQSKSLYEKRIGLAFKNIERFDENIYFNEFKDGCVYLKNNIFQQRVEWSIDNDKLKFCTWLADTKSQMWNFKEYYASKQFIKLNDKQDSKMYIKFSNCGNWNHSLYLNTDFDGDLNKYDQLYEKAGRKKGLSLKESIDEIINLTNSQAEIDEKIEKYIDSDVVKDISVGIVLIDKIEISELLQYEPDVFNKNMAAADDNVAKYIYDYIINNLIFQKDK